VYVHAGASAQRQAVNRLEDRMFPRVSKLRKVEHKPNQQMIEFADEWLVDVTGIEPATPCLQSTKLYSNRSNASS